MKIRSIIILLLLSLSLFSCKSSDDSADVSVDVIDQDDDNTTATIDDNYVYTLPVIFHVLTPQSGNATEVSSTRLAKILQNVNDLYKGGVYGDSENANVKFVLATHDESGNKLPTPGMEIVSWTGEYPINPSEFMNDNTGKNAAILWDPNDYINVMLYEFKSETDNHSVTLGISHIPYTVKGDSALIGLNESSFSFIKKSQLKYAYCSSINSLYLNSESTRYTLTDKGKNGYSYTTSDINVAMAHEFGHYLGLFHTFSESNDDGNIQYEDTCYDTDFCDDTPSYNRVDYESFFNYYFNEHSSDGAIDMRDLVVRNNCEGNTFDSENIMDYSVGYSFAITPDQNRRIRQVLYNSPLIPGPKMLSTRSNMSTANKLDLPITFVK